MAIDKKSEEYIKDNEVRKLQEVWLEKVQQLSPRRDILITEAQDFNGTWHTLKECHEKNHTNLIVGRSILTNELVLECDEDWTTVKEVDKKLRKTFSRLSIPYVHAFSGGKSLHNHIFFDASKVSVDSDLAKKIEKYEIDVTLITRITLVKYILKEANIEGDDIDYSNITWRSKSKGHLIRCIGCLRENRAFKTAIDTTPEEKPQSSEFDLRFPEKADLWEIPITLHSEIINRIKETIEGEKQFSRYTNKEFCDVEGSNIFDVLLKYDPEINLSQYGDYRYYTSHPVHGSTSGQNFHIDIAKNIFYCFRDHTGGGILQLIAILEGIIECKESVKGVLRGDKFRETLRIAKEKYQVNIETGGNIIIPLVHGEKDFGILYIKRKSAKKVIVNINKDDDVILPETEVSFEFHQQIRKRDEVFKHIKEELNPQEYVSFLSTIIEEIKSTTEGKGKQIEDLTAFRATGEKETQENRLTFDPDFLLYNPEGFVIGIKHSKVAEALLLLFNFKTLRDTDEVLYYDEGYYHYTGEAVIRAECERVLKPKLTTYDANEIINHIRRSTYIKRKQLNADPWTLNLENGLLNLKMFEFRPHTPDFLSTIRTSVEYNPDADCPHTTKFVNEIVYEDQVPLIWEMIGYTLYHDYPYQNWFLLVGEGESGKSTLLSLVSKFLGEENVAAVGLQKLDQRFEGANLYGKSANIVADLSDVDLKRTGNLKALTGGDLISAEKKFKDSFKFRNFAKLIYSCNKIPMTMDNTMAFFRRIILIPCPNRFTIGVNADERLIEKLTTKEELSGLLNKAIAGLQQLLKNHTFSNSSSAEEIEEEYQRMSNPVFGFFHGWCKIDVEEYTPKPELFAEFCEYCKEKKVVPLSEKRFIDQMRLLTKMEDGRRGKFRHQQRVWLGIVVTHSHDRHDFLYLSVRDFFYYKEKNIKKNIKGTLDIQKGVYDVYDNYDTETFLVEWLKSESKNCGSGVCKGCNNEKSDLWAFKINDTEGGFCLDCIKNAIEQELKKIEGKVKESEKQKEPEDIKEEHEETEKQEKEVKEKSTPIEIKKFTIGTSKCKECGKEDIDLVYVVHYSNDEFKNVCKRCGERIMHDYNLKLSGGENKIQ